MVGTRISSFSHHPHQGLIHSIGAILTSINTYEVLCWKARALPSTSHFPGLSPGLPGHPSLHSTDSRVNGFWREPSTGSPTAGANRALPLVRPGGGEPLPRSSVPPSDRWIRGTIQRMGRDNGPFIGNGGISSFRILGNEVDGGMKRRVEEWDDARRAPAKSSIRHVEVRTRAWSLHLKQTCGGELQMAYGGGSDGCIHM